MRFSPSGQARTLTAVLVVLIPRLAIAADDRIAAVEKAVQSGMRDFSIPGVAVGIYHKDFAYSRGFGVTSIENPLPVTEDTLFTIASISKTFTGTAVMSLVEKGLLDLNAPVRKYLPDFRVKDEHASASATVMTLLTHMGGWDGDYMINEFGNGDDALRRTVAGMFRLDQLAPPHTRWSYNNSGLYVAGRLIELVTGKSFENALRDLVIRPLALTRTYLAPEEVMTLRFAVGHNISGGAPRISRMWMLNRGSRPGGGVISCVTDMLQYARFHLGHGRPAADRVLAPASLRRMQSPVVQRVDADDQMAITWFWSNAGGLHTLWHGGGNQGQTTSLTLIPSRDFAVVVLTNGSTGPALYREINRVAVREFLKVKENDPQVDPRFASGADAAIGRYSSAAAKLLVTAPGSELIVSRTPQQPVPAATPEAPERFGFYAPDRLICLEGPARGSRIEILRNDDGSVGWIRHRYRLHKREVP